MHHTAIAFCLMAASASAQGLTPFGRHCGPLLDGRARFDGNNRVLQLELVNAFPSAAGLVVLGNQPASLQIPGTNCYLNVLPIVLLPFATDASGKASHALRVPVQMTAAICLQDFVVRSRSGKPELRSSNGLKAGPWFGVHSFGEDFKTIAKADFAASSAQWIGDGELVAAKIGGTGILGDFDVRFGGKDTKTKDAAGRDIWQWSTDNVTIPASRTLTGKAITVTNGIFEFRSFPVPATMHVRFVGKNPPVLKVADNMTIDGVLTNAGTDGLRRNPPRPPVDGQDGRRGGAGGADGGRGGDSPKKIGQKNIHGSPGSNAIVPSGHPLFTQRLDTGGGGSRANPPSGLDRDVKFSAYAGSICQMVSAGGGGGGNRTAGFPGRAFDNMGRGQHPPQPYDLGPPSLGGKGMPYNLLFNRPEPSTFLYAIGGSGGGGTGTHPNGSFTSSIHWNPGNGGAGGGGPLTLRIAGDLSVTAGALLSVRGGHGTNILYNASSFFNPSPGAAGSGGNLLVQICGKVDLRGAVEATGGLDGLLNTDHGFLLRADAASGKGGDGFVRFEADPPIPLSSLGAVKPPAKAENSALLRKVDQDIVSDARSLWYDARRLPAFYYHYVIDAKVANQRVVFSDDPARGRPAVSGQPVVLFAQSARLDTNGKPIGTPTPWFEGDLSGLSRHPNRGNGFRFRVRFDRAKTPSGKGAVAVNDLRVVFEG